MELVHERFERRVQEAPDRLAVWYDGDGLSYQALNARADGIANRLTARSIGPEHIVGIFLERSVDAIAAVIAILKSGAAYLPLDPAWPSHRSAAIVHDARASTVISTAGTLARHSLALSDPLLLDCPPSGAVAVNERQGRIRCGPDHAAYVIYTSGSTGAPKGVVVQHGSLVNLLDALERSVYAANAIGHAIVGVNGPLAFDTSVKQIIQLAAGGTLVVIPDRCRFDAESLTAHVRASSIEVLDCTPTQLHVWLRAGLLDESGPSPRLLLVAGEAIDAPLWSALQRAPHTVGYNLYGPTECTVDATGCRIDASRAIPVLGAALDGVSVHVLDDRLEPTAGDATGELYVGGRGVARGYLRDPARTAERFLPDPFSTEPGRRLYRTGDRARRLPNGDVEFLGRVDFQVKVRGFRVELGEIESVLREHAGVRETVVVPVTGERGDARLVAYVIGRDPTASTELEAALREHLRARLPEHMVPSAFMHLATLPVTPNGKVDRARLPAPVFRVEPSSRLPSTEMEQLVASIWCEVLGCAQVGVDDSFFDRGGHSLLVGQVAARLREAAGRDVPVHVLFERDTVAKVAQWLSHADADDSSAAAAIAPAIRRPRHPVSSAQERIWFLQQLAPGNLAYLFRTVIRLAGPLDAPSLARALTEIVRRHEIFRTTFGACDGSPFQAIHEPWTVTLDVLDVSGRPDPAAELKTIADREFRIPFDLSALPLIRWQLVRLGPDEHGLVQVEHHLIHDGWSFNVFLTELRDLYAAFARGEPSPLPELTIQFVDFCEWQRQWLQTEAAARQIAFWTRRLTDAPVLQLPFDRPRAHLQRFRGAIRRITVEPPRLAALRAAGRAHNVTLFMTMLTAFVGLLSRRSGQRDVCVGGGIANRRERATEALIGMIINTVVFRVQFERDVTLGRLLQRVRAAALEVYEHQDAPFDAVVDAVQPRRDLSHNPLFQVGFGFQDAPLPELCAAGLTIEPAHLLDNGSAKFDLNVITIPPPLRQDGSGATPSAPATMIWEYNSDLFDGSTIEAMTADYVTLLDTIAASPDTRLADVPLRRKAKLPAQTLDADPALLSDLSPRQERARRMLAAIWSDVLGCATVTARDNFFALGGKSLAAMQVVSRISEELGVELPLDAVFERPVLEDLASTIAHALPFG